VPLRQSLPDFFAVPGAQGADATPRMLLSHTAGFLGHLSGYGSGAGPERTPGWLTDLDCFVRYKCHSRYDPEAPAGRQELERCVHQISRLPLAAPGGVKWVYSNPGYEIIALLVQRLAGLRFEDAFQQLIARPLGLASSSYECEPPGSTADYPHPATGLCTTVADYGKILQMLLLGGRAPGGEVVVPAPAIDQIFAAQTRGASLMDTDPFFDGNLLGGRCVVDEAKASSCLDYGLGAFHHLGFKTEAFAHASHMGSVYFIAPGRFAVVVGTSFVGGSAVIAARILRAIEALEETNHLSVATPAGEVSAAMCPTSIRLAGSVAGFSPSEQHPNGTLVHPTCGPPAPSRQPADEPGPAERSEEQCPSGRERELLLRPGRQERPGTRTDTDCPLPSTNHACTPSNASPVPTTEP